MALVINGTTGITNPGTEQVATTIGVGNATPANTGAGITFPATQSASSDANTLDDYEEGTWTPSVGGNATYNVQNARYVKVGKLVMCNFDIHINVLGTGSATTLSGFPFSGRNGSFVQAGSVIYFANSAISIVYMGVYLQDNAATAVFTAGQATNAASIAQNATGFFGNNTRIVGSITYETST